MMRELLTTVVPPPSGSALLTRTCPPESKVVPVEGRASQRRMWDPEDVQAWCRERQPPRMQEAFACLDRHEKDACYAESPELLRMALRVLDKLEELDGKFVDHNGDWNGPEMRAVDLLALLLCARDEIGGDT